MRKDMTAPVVGFLLCCGGISFFFLFVQFVTLSPNDCMFFKKMKKKSSFERNELVIEKEVV